MIQFLVGEWPCYRLAQVFLALATAFTVTGFLNQAFGQVPDLSIIDRRVKEGQKEPQKRQLPPAAPSVAEPALKAPPTQPFTLSGVVIEGATVIAPADLTGFYENYLLKPVGDREIDTILRKITERYQNAGYYLSRAVAPAQEVVNGILRIRVVEGYVSKFSPQGDYPNPALLDAYIRPVLAERPARLETVERALLLMSDLPGLSLEPKIKPVDEGHGTYELIAVLKYQPVSAYVSLDNRGTPDVGRLQNYYGVGLNGLLGLGESINANFATVPNTPKELLFGSLSGTLPIGRNGTYASLYGGYGAIDAGGNSAQYDTNSTSQQVIAQIGHPIIRSRAQTLWLGGSFDYRNFEQTQFDQTIVDDRLRVLRANVSYALKDEWKGDSQVSLGISQGLDILDASDEGSSKISRSDGHSQFTKLNGNAVRLQGITDNISMRVSIAGQWSADPLLSYEEFSLGGEGYGRGYDYGELTGEHGAAGSGEIRYGSEMNWPWLSEYQLYGFYDVGAVWNKASGDDLTMDHLSSAGAGLRLRLNDYVRTRFEAAKPLDRRVSTTGDRDWRFFFSAVAKY